MESKLCGICGLVKPLSEFHQDPKSKRRHSRCKECRRSHQREYWKKRREYYRKLDQEPERAHRRAVRIQTFMAIRNGKLKRQPCEVCGTTERIEAHHDDYSKPLEVRWLCTTHHAEHHSKLDRRAA
jgi:hypothetical protein